ncbi:MAG: hypothetical protein GAK30_02431 [Paracidovorax wautersii]|uniref:Uncharacterized protein n=1 Tax=Paracidovorax wautersii TaxID=1177982 RepID=A0A7V8JPT3_9BURK|nr:MAG: hypothetical protein GAK30_02431 [Paracidovorax wautersii]
MSTPLPSPSFALPRLRAGRALPSVALALILGLLATELARLPWLAEHGLGALVLAMLLGMALGNTRYPAWQPACDSGVAWSRQTLLRAGIVLYGLRLTLQDIGHMGWAGVAADAAVLCSTFALAVWIGTRWLGLERGTAILIGAGSSICGAAAVLATAPVARARADQVAVAVATVVVFGTLAVFIYPLLYTLALQATGDAAAVARFFGLYVGATVHEVAQVVATGRSLGAETAGDAVVAKLVRVLMLAPFLATLAWWLGRGGRRAAGTAPAASLAQSMPWFAVAFMAVVALNSAIAVPPALAQALRALDDLLLASAMAALGLGIQHSALRRAGFKPLLLAGLLFVWLMAGGALFTGLAMATR